jgi:hypothetical protein
LVLKCKIIGVLEVIQKDGKQKISKQIREEIEKFFVATDELEAKELQFLSGRGPKPAKS